MVSLRLLRPPPELGRSGELTRDFSDSNCSSQCLCPESWDDGPADGGREEGLDQRPADDGRIRVRLLVEALLDALDDGVGLTSERRRKRLRSCRSSSRLATAALGWTTPAKFRVKPFMAKRQRGDRISLDLAGKVLEKNSPRQINSSRCAELFTAYHAAGPAPAKARAG